jgi:long-chain acyl-CoA synthetase
MSYSTIPEMFLYLCKKYDTSRTALMYKKDGVFKNISYGELQEQVECFSLGLLNLGIRSGDRVGIVSENRPEWIIADLAISNLGAVDVPIFPTLTSKQEEYIFRDSETVAIVCSNKFQLSKIMEFKDNMPSLRQIIVMNTDFQSDDICVKSFQSIIDSGKQLRNTEKRHKLIEEHAAKIQPDDLLTIIYTSGTTGNPKGVMLTHGNIVANIQGAHEAIHFTENDTFLSYLPFCHAYERTTGYYAAFSAGSVIAIAESVETVAANMSEVKPTIMTTVPRLLEMIRKRILANIDKESAIKKAIFNQALKTGKDYHEQKKNGKTSIITQTKYNIAQKLVFSKIQEKTGGKLRMFVSGGAALAPEVAVFFQAMGFVILEGYGLTEASPIVSVNREDDLEVGTIGKPLFNVEVRFADDGEILARGPSIMKGYWNDKAATDSAIDDEGWLYTGDIGYLTEKNNIKITDRKKNILVSSGGKNIAPQPIENLLSQSPFVEQVVLLGDRKEYCTALITPDFEQLKALADNLGIKYSSPSELISNQQIISVIKRDIDRLQKDLAKFERVRKFSLLSEPFSVDNGELTPKLSIRRHVVERKYSYLIEQMYDVNY